jgi:hypothetical protein
MLMDMLEKEANEKSDSAYSIENENDDTKNIETSAKLEEDINQEVMIDTLLNHSFLTIIQGR